MSRMNENRNLISMRQRRMIRQLNKELQARKNRRETARKVFAAIMTVCAANRFGVKRAEVFVLRK